MSEPQWLDRDLVDELHNQSLLVHGGLPGIRDGNALEAAIASPRNLWAYGGEDNPFRLAAHLLVSLAKAHPLQRWEQAHCHHFRGGFSG